jgi:hypothetical protein
MATIIGKEWGNTGSFSLVVIGGELSQRKSERQIILFMRHIGLEILFQNCIDVLHLAICFWVGCGGES